MINLIAEHPPMDATRALRAPLPATRPLPTGVANNVAQGEQLLGYELLEQIGAGGMGTVFRARHVWLARDVAIKFIAAPWVADAEAKARFAQETRALGTLDHPLVVRALDAGCDRGRHFLVTEFVDGCDLGELVKRVGRLRVADACEIIRQAALGLQHAHERGVVHRDVKPANLRLDRRGYVRLLDFGLARLASDQGGLTCTGQFLGTLDYLAPEQACDARDVSYQADLYSLGCTFYFLLCCVPPFSGPAYDNAASKLKGHLADQPITLEQRNVRIPTRVRTVLERMMANEPSHRPASAAAVAAMLRPLAAKANLAALVSATAYPGGSKSARRGVLTRLIEIALLPATVAGNLCRNLLNVPGKRRATYGMSPPRRAVFSWSGSVMMLLLMAAVAWMVLRPLLGIGVPNNGGFRIEVGPMPANVRSF